MAAESFTRAVGKEFGTESSAMTQPRHVVPGGYYKITRRCTQQQFLLRPDDATNNNYVFCLGYTSKKFGITVISVSVESNHHHLTIYDPLGNFPEFTELLHGVTGRSQNSLRGRRENFWASGQCSVVQLLDRDAVINSVVYDLTNPVKDGLVEEVHHWPGVNSFAALAFGHELKATRPRHFFRENGPVPDKVSLKIEFPKSFANREQAVQEVRARVAEFEEKTKAERLKSGKRILGRKTVQEQSWRAHTVTRKTDKNARRKNPHFSGSNYIFRALGRIEYKTFIHAYRVARREWLQGIAAIFPAGTYWLRRFAGVPVSTHALPLAA